MTDTTPDEGRSAFRHDGGDVGVLLFHGFTSDPASLRAWADHLVTEGYSVRLPLLPGHGTRWQDANHTTFADWLGAATGGTAGTWPPRAEPSWSAGCPWAAP